MRDCAAECYASRVCCENKECRLHLDFEEDLNCTLITVKKHGPLTLAEVARRHRISTVRAKQLVDAALLKLKKTFIKENTI